MSIRSKNYGTMTDWINGMRRTSVIDQAMANTQCMVSQCLARSSLLDISESLTLRSRRMALQELSC